MKIVICSGAGLSAESGVPTFRTSGGLWLTHHVDEVCDLFNFYQNYDKVHDFYNDRRADLKNVEPNSAHLKIAELSKSFNVVNLTTNVDDLLERAGCKNVIHMHGILTQVIQDYDTDKASIVDIGYNKIDYLDTSHYPLKPNVVFFNEFAPEYQKFNNEIADLTADDLVIIIGSSESVFYFIENIRYLGQFNGKILFVNPDTKLCEKAKEDCDVFNMNSTDFFKQFDPLLYMK